MDERRVREIAEQHGVKLLLQFGSTVAGTVHARSDIDLAALLDRPSISREQYAELLHDLQALYPDREVDLVLINRADPLLLKKIMESARLLYGSVRQLRELRMLAFKRYQDHRRYLELERRFVGSTLEKPGARGSS